jgi:anti-sigma regulatory factor (Ser/Thr protein kinase)
VSEALSVELPLEPESARRAREQLERFRRYLDEMSYEDLRLLVHELVVEALNAEPDPRAGTIELQAEVRDERIRVEMSQGEAAYRLPSRRPEPGELGFGLHLLRRLAHRWGIGRDPNRARVWLEMPLSPAA